MTFQLLKIYWVAILQDGVGLSVFYLNDLPVQFWLAHLLLYIFLFAASTALLIIITQLIISDDTPYLTGLSSPLALAPGIGMKPKVDFRTAMISYAASDPQTYIPYVQDLRTFVYFYEEMNVKPQDGFATCEGNVKSPADPNRPCKFYPRDLGLCVKENNYGYDRSQPCVILKINNVYGWLPDISNNTASPNPLIRCGPRYFEDEDNFGSLRYYPNVTINNETFGHFSNLYFPYVVQISYRSPLVAVQFTNPKRHVLLMVKCELLNLRSEHEPLFFELLVD